jgi:hypothetical protein
MTSCLSRRARDWLLGTPATARFGMSLLIQYLIDRRWTLAARQAHAFGHAGSAKGGNAETSAYSREPASAKGA